MQSIDHELKIEKVAEAPNGAMRLLLSDGSEWVVGIKSWNRLNLSLEKILDLNVLRALEKESQYHLLLYEYISSQNLPRMIASAQ